MMSCPHAIGSPWWCAKECQFSRLHDDEVPVPVGWCVFCVLDVQVVGWCKAKNGDGKRTCVHSESWVGIASVLWRCSFMAGQGLIAGLIKREPTVFIRPDQVRPDISGRHMFVRGENRLTSHNSWEMFERLACFFGHVGGKVFTFTSGENC